MSETRRHRLIWSAVGFLHLAAIVGVVTVGSMGSRLEKPEEGGVMLIVLEDEAIVHPGEVLDGLAVGKGVAVKPPADSPAPITVAANSQPAVHMTDVTPVVIAQTITVPAKVESRGLAPVEFVPPTFLIRKEPVYPEKTRRAGIEGRVVLKIFISASGMIRSTEIVTSSGNQALDQAALNAVRASKFSPAQCDHLPVESHATASYRFELR